MWSLGVVGDAGSELLHPDPVQQQGNPCQDKTRAEGDSPVEVAPSTGTQLCPPSVLARVGSQDTALGFAIICSDVQLHR